MKAPLVVSLVRRGATGILASMACKAPNTTEPKTLNPKPLNLRSHRSFHFPKHCNLAYRPEGSKYPNVRRSCGPKSPFRARP